MFVLQINNDTFMANHEIETQWMGKMQWCKQHAH